MSANEYDNSEQAKSWQVPLLVLILVIGAAISYATSISAARMLGPVAFEDYAVVIATLGLLSTLAEGGIGKYGLRIIPAYVAGEEWSLAAGYWRFGLRLSLSLSVGLSLFVIVLEGYQDGEFWNYPLATGVLFLPAFALTGICVDLILANRSAVAGTTISRVVVPAIGLLLMLLAGYLWPDITSAIAVACLGIGSCAGIVVGAAVFWKTSPPHVFTFLSEYERPHWYKECAAFASIGFLMTWIFRISLLILEMLPISEAEVAYFAAALETGCLILLLSKSTDKLFQPDMAVVIERRDVAMGIRFRNRRYVVMGGGCLVFLMTVVVFGREILQLYGPEFTNGYPALCFVSLGTCVWTMFSLAPIYLRFVGFSLRVGGITIVGAAVMAILTVPLGFFYGATGAGIAFSVVLCTMATTFLILARRQFKQLVQHVDGR